MSSVYDDIREALEVKLSNTSNLPSQIAWENVKFSPTTGTAYLETRLVPTTRRPSVRGLNPQMRYDGFLRILVYVPENEGPATADGYANTLIEAFEATTDLSANGTFVSIDYAERAQGITQSPWYYIPVEIGWYTYA